LRDSWFAGFSGTHLGVVWMGTDDNQPTGLTGSSGALLLWGDIFRNLSMTGVQLENTEEVVVASVNPELGLLAAPECEGSMYLAFKAGTQPTESSSCQGSGIKKQIEDTLDWFKRLFK
jgi:penicillin-binding protein 1B